MMRADVAAHEWEPKLHCHIYTHTSTACHLLLTLLAPLTAPCSLGTSRGVHFSQAAMKTLSSNPTARGHRSARRAAINPAQGPARSPLLIAKASSAEGSQGQHQEEPDDEQRWSTSLSSLNLRIAQLQAKELTTGYKPENLQAVVEDSAAQRPDLPNAVPTYAHYEQLTAW